MDDQGEGTSSGIRAAAGHKRTQPTVEEVANMYHEDDDTDEDGDDIEELNAPRTAKFYNPSTPSK